MYLTPTNKSALIAGFLSDAQTCSSVFPESNNLDSLSAENKVKSFRQYKTSLIMMHFFLQSTVTKNKNYFKQQQQEKHCFFLFCFFFSVLLEYQNTSVPLRTSSVSFYFCSFDYLFLSTLSLTFNSVKELCFVYQRPSSSDLSF